MGSSSLVHQTPDDPHEPTAGEPTIMAFRRPADRPASGGGTKSPSARSQPFAAADALPVVLRLPDLAGSQSVPPPVAPSGSPRPWIGIAMWCATGALAVVAVVLIFTGKPENLPPADEAPRWQPGASESDRAEYSPSVGNAGQGFDPSQPADGVALAPAVGVTAPPATDDSSSFQSGTSTGQSGEPADPAPFPNDVFPNDAVPTGAPPSYGLPPAMAPGDTLPGGTAPGGGTGPGRAAPAGPGGGLLQPMVNPNGAAGYGDGNAGASVAPPPDQSKVQTTLRTARQSTPGGARFDGRIQNLVVRPSDDSSR